MNLGRRRIFVPEVVQTSAMDCGPAALKCLAEGFSIPVSYGRLREACQTDVDGTSIDTMEEVAVQLGLDAEQIMAPADFVLLPRSPSFCVPTRRRTSWWSGAATAVSCKSWTQPLAANINPKRILLRVSISTRFRFRRKAGGSGRSRRNSPSPCGGNWTIWVFRTGPRKDSSNRL